jgi:NAD(P)-dependent dehydrogenase (short-subunit alcohol dehydrogenase family)
VLKTQFPKGYSNMELAEKTCLIVGASGAIGRAIAERFYAEGARVALTYHTQKPVADFRDSPAKRLRLPSFPLDVRKQREVRSIVARVARKFGSINVLVNCSGVLGPVGNAQAVSATAWRQTLEVNLFGGFYLVQAVLPFMLAASRGKIILFSGGGAAYARPHFTAYSASKAALVRFTESISEELIDKNIQINIIAPGPVKSRMWDDLRASGSAGGPKALEELRNMDATGGVPPERAAALALFLASDRSNGLSGRLISAIHDKWEDLGPRIPDIMSSEAGTLRRVPFN